MSEKKCVICMDAKIDTVCVPCGHRCLCVECSDLIMKQKKCPICRSNIDQIIKTYDV